MLPISYALNFFSMVTSKKVFLSPFIKVHLNLHLFKFPIPPFKINSVFQVFP